MTHAKSAKFAKFLRRSRDHETDGRQIADAIETILSACGLTLRVAAAHVIVSPYRVIAAASDTKRRRGGATKTPAFAGYTKKVRI